MELDVKPSTDTKKGIICQQLEKGHSINLYTTTPFGQITLEECEDLFRQRLEALHVMENYNDLSETLLVAKSLRDIKSYVHKTNCTLLRATDKQQHKLDHYSHMLARMYCVCNPNLWDWFKNCEKKLFNYRIRDQASSLSSVQLESILKNFNFSFEKVVGSQLTHLYKENLIGWNRNTGDNVTDIFKVNFTAALKFISRRSVSLENGYAFLTRHEIISVVCDVFEKHLDDELIYARQHINLELPQTQHLLDSLTLVYADYREKVDEERKVSRKGQDDENHNPYRIDVDNLDDISENHFPPCMRYLHESLKQDHHLKHQGRLYYGAFLRTGGVDMDTAVDFWRKEFTKKPEITNDKFDRNYKYNIRHLYGKEGQKKALTSFSCDKIIGTNAPGPSDKHGCPFRHFDDSNLKSLLTKHGLKEVDIESLVMIKNDQDPKMACSHYYKFRKGEFPTEPIKNPAQYYYESMRLENRPAAIEGGDEQPIPTDIDLRAFEEDMEE